MDKMLSVGRALSVHRLNEPGATVPVIKFTVWLGLEKGTESHALNETSVLWELPGGAVIPVRS